MSLTTFEDINVGEFFRGGRYGAIYQKVNNITKYYRGDRDTLCNAILVDCGDFTVFSDGEFVRRVKVKIIVEEG